MKQLSKRKIPHLHPSLCQRESQKYCAANAKQISFYGAEVTTISFSRSWIEPALLSSLCSRSIAAIASLNRKPAYGITLGSIGIRPIAPLLGDAVTFPPAI